MNVFRTALAASMLPVALLAAPASAASAQTERFATSMTERQSPAPYAGSLTITIDAQGIIHGFFTPDSGPPLVPVVGGKVGNAIWFDIGNDASVRVEGTIDNGIITGSAYEVGHFPLRFVARPESGTPGQAPHLMR